MEPSQATLAERVGTLRAAAQADSARATCLHALIMSCLARIFARLEQMLLLWQSGTLPLPHAPNHSPRRHTSHTRPNASRRTTRRRSRRSTPTPGIPPRQRATWQIPPSNRLPTDRAAPRARSVRLPPPH